MESPTTSINRQFIQVSSFFDFFSFKTASNRPGKWNCPGSVFCLSFSFSINVYFFRALIQGKFELIRKIMVNEHSWVNGGTIGILYKPSADDLNKISAQSGTPEWILA